MVFYLTKTPKIKNLGGSVRYFYIFHVNLLKDFEKYFLFYRKSPPRS